MLVLLLFFLQLFFFSVREFFAVLFLELPIVFQRHYGTEFTTANSSQERRQEQGICTVELCFVFRQNRQPWRLWKTPGLSSLIFPVKPRHRTKDRCHDSGPRNWFDKCMKSFMNSYFISFFVRIRTRLFFFNSFFTQGRFCLAQSFFLHIIFYHYWINK